jgi:hypothetical protein
MSRLLVLRGAVGVVMATTTFLRGGMIADTNLCSRNSVRRLGRGSGRGSRTSLSDGYVRGVERQLALRRSRSNELLELGGFCPHVKSRNRGKRQSSAMAAPRERQDDLFKLFTKDEPVLTSAAAGMPQLPRDSRKALFAVGQPEGTGHTCRQPGRSLDIDCLKVHLGGLTVQNRRELLSGVSFTARPGWAYGLTVGGGMGGP